MSCYRHEDDGTFYCRGCSRAMCSLGFAHEDDGTFYCKGCSRAMCSLGLLMKMMELFIVEDAQEQCVV